MEGEVEEAREVAAVEEPLRRARFAPRASRSAVAFSSTTLMPVIPRRVARARSRPRRVASCQLSGDAAVIVETEATAIALPVEVRAGRE